LKVADIPGAKFVMLLEYNAASDYWELLNPSQTRNPLNLYNASTPSSAEGDIYYDASIGLFYGNNSIAGGADAIPTLILADSRYAAKNNAALTGNPTAPTAADGDNDTSIATTAFTQNALRFPPMQAGGGTVDAITATFTPALTLTDKIRCYIVAAGANTITNPTFAPNSLTARTITRFGGQELVPGDIYGAGHVLLLEYNSANTRWELLNPAYPPVNYMSLTATYTGSSQTALQKLFNTPSNGSFTAVAGITYEFECQFSLSSMSGSSGTFSFGFLGTATFTSLFYIAMTRKSAATVISSTVATITAITASDTTTTGIAYIRGTLRVNAAGTIIPAFGLGVAAAAVVGVNSFFKIWPIGTNTFTSKGAFT
jgi:hypothetical protein